MRPVNRPGLREAAIAVAAALLGGCGTVCGDLEDVCASCPDPTVKVSCDASVAVGHEEHCAEDISTYEGLGCK
jgi:hypothetical protein